MNTLDLILTLAGVICFVLAAVRFPSTRIDLVALGLALVFTVPLITYIKAS